MKSVLSSSESLTATAVMPAPPLVSIIMPCHNGQATLLEAVASAREQTFVNWEMLVVDDGSTDSTAAMLAEIAGEEPRIRILRNARASGVAAARNRALSEARGQYIAFLDCDDVWLSHKLETQLRVMKRAQAALSAGAYKAMDIDGTIIGRFRPRAGLLTYRSLLGNNRIGTLTVMIDRSLCPDVRFDPRLPQSEDYHLWLNILKRGLVGICLGDTLAVYRVHGGTLSSNKFSVARNRWRVYREFEKLGFFRSAFYFISYSFWGVKKMIEMNLQRLISEKHNSFSRPNPHGHGSKAVSPRKITLSDRLS